MKCLLCKYIHFVFCLTDEVLWQLSWFFQKCMDMDCYTGVKFTAPKWQEEKVLPPIELIFDKSDSPFDGLKCVFFVSEFL